VQIDFFRHFKVSRIEYFTPTGNYYGAYLTLKLLKIIWHCWWFTVRFNENSEMACFFGGGHHVYGRL